MIPVVGVWLGCVSAVYVAAGEYRAGVTQDATLKRQDSTDKTHSSSNDTSSQQNYTTQNYTTRIWQTQDGLAQQTVQAVAQTQDGFVWIGTTGGLLRFDGTHFFTFNRENTPEFQEDSIFSLTTGQDGTLWIGTEGGGLISLREGVFRHFGVAEGLMDGFVRTVLEDRVGTIWIGTDNGLFQLVNGRAAKATRVDGTAGLPAMAVHALAQIADGAVWVGGSRLVALRGGGGERISARGQAWGDAGEVDPAGAGWNGVGGDG